MKRHAALSIPDIDLVGADYMAWHAMYMAYSEWADAQHDVYVAIASGRHAVDSRVRDLFGASENAHKIAELQTKKLLQAVGLTPKDAQRIVAVSETAPEWEPPA
jgi:hypothetical protein